MHDTDVHDTGVHDTDVHGTDLRASRSRQELEHFLTKRHSRIRSHVSDVSKYMKRIPVAGDDDSQLRQIIHDYKLVAPYFKQHSYPHILNGNDYNAISFLGEGTHARILICEHLSTRQQYVIKVPKQHTDEKAMRRLLREYMLQHHAYHALQNHAASGKHSVSCSAPRPIGFIKHRTSSGDVYMIVSEFCSVLSAAEINFTLKKALEKHECFTLTEWRDICLTIIEGLAILQKNDIYHLDIKSDNILLRFSKDCYGPPEPVIIDFGNSRRKQEPDFDGTVSSQKYRSRQDDFPHVPPENYILHTPHPTCDLYAFSHTINKMTKIVGSLNTVQHYIAKFRQKRYDQRESFDEMKLRLKSAFDKDIHNSSSPPRKRQRYQ